MTDRLWEADQRRQVEGWDEDAVTAYLERQASSVPPLSDEARVIVAAAIRKPRSAFRESA